MCIAEAAARNLKTNDRKQAVECRKQADTRHLLEHNCDVEKMAGALGWQPAKGGRPLTAMERWEATNSILDAIAGGATVKVIASSSCRHCGPGGGPLVYIQNEHEGRRLMRARFELSTLVRTERVRMTLGNEWIESVVSREKPVKTAFPISWVGARGWQTPVEGRFWPRIASRVASGYTGTSQTQSLLVRFERWRA
jgi:hypothetical protein